MSAPVLPQHVWLKQLLGTWTYTGDCDMGPDKPRVSMTGEETNTALGPYWVLCQAKMSMPNGEFMDARITLGYDTAATQFVGTFAASVMDSLWVYTGQLNDNQIILTLDTVGPSMTDPGKTTAYQDIHELIPGKPNERIFRSRMKVADGTWKEFMTAQYRKA